MGLETATLMYIAIGASVAGAGVSAYSSYQSGKANQRINEYNARVAEQAALDKERDGKIIANATRANNERIQSRQRALFAKSGVVGGTGSPLMVMAEQAAQLEMGALDAERTASNESSSLRTQAVLDRMAGKAARKAGALNAAGTILSGAGQAGSMYAAGRADGIFKTS